MWYPVSLKIVNLFSHEDSTFDFVNNQTTLVSGVNKTDSNVQSNGSGKTSILDCISIALIGEPLRDISKKEIVRNGEKSGQCILVLKNNVLNKEFQIVRDINATKSSNALLYENGELNINLKDLEVKETDKYILKQLGISKEDLVNYFLISKDSYQSFFLNGDVAKKQIINRFSKADTVDAVEPLMKTDIEVLDLAINKTQNQLNINVGILSHLDAEINQEKLESSIEQTRKLTLDALEERKAAAIKLCDELPDLIELKEREITYQNSVVENKRVQLTELEEQNKGVKFSITNLEIALQNIDLKKDQLEVTYKPQFDKIKQEIADCEVEIKEYNSSIKEARDDIGKIDIVLAGQIECPKCSFKFILKDKEYNVEEALIQKDELNSFIESAKELVDGCNVQLLELDQRLIKLKTKLTADSEIFNQEKSRIKEEIVKLDEKVSQFRKDINEQFNIVSKEQGVLNTLIRELGELDGKADYYIGQIDDCDKAIKTETDKVYPDKTAETKEKIVKLKEQNEQLQIDIDKKIDEKNILLEWQIRFKQFKSFLANSSISAIEEMTNYFLLKMKTNLTVQIEGYRELSNKKLKEEITTLVTRDGLNGESFSKFSGGEKARVDIACILAMQKIINLASNGGGLNLLFIDEILESVDSLALTGIVKALSELDQTIFLITHVEQNMFECNKLLVEKTNGISKIVSL